MAVKKSDLYSSLWESCNELRGGMDASQYKDYVLSLLFVKYISDKWYGKDDAPIVIPDGASFYDIVALKGKADIGDQINKIIQKIANENDLTGVIDLTDFNDEEKLGKWKEMVDRLSKLIGIFENPNLNFSHNRADGDDILGDAYEYLMRHFATESGKSKWQFYTPAEVSRVLAKVIGVEKSTSSSQTVYDPTCGSGSLLLKVADEVRPRNLTLYGQEMDNATKALAVMNMWLHNYPSAEIWKGNTLANPYFKEQDGQLKRFDYVVANPPFSTKSWSNWFDPSNDVYQRFTGYGIPPAKNGDYAFLLHIVSSLKSTGKGAVILPHGVLFRGNAEWEIRKNLIKTWYIKGIIGLPANLFYGTGIPACIIVLDKEDAEHRKGIFMIDASKWFIKDGNKNRLREQDIHKIVDTFTNFREVDKYARMVSFDEIEKNDYNLNIPRYIDTQEEEDLQDLTAHLQGGIPAHDVDALSPYWSVYGLLKSTLFKPDTKPGYYQLAVDRDTIKETIYMHDEFIAYSKTLKSIFDRRVEEIIIPECKAITTKTQPKKFIHTLGESILEYYSDIALVDKYAIYQHLMDYRNETMKDDLYMIIEDGRKATLTETKKWKETVYICDLILPEDLVINRYFINEKNTLTALEGQLETITARIEELAEEHGWDEWLLAEVVNDKGKLTKANVTNRMKAIKNSAEDIEEYNLLQECLTELEKEADTKSQIKALQSKLSKNVIDTYRTLTGDEIQTLVINDKWIGALDARISREIDSISQWLTQRIVQLAERYSSPLPQLTQKVADYEKKVQEHLKTMWFSF